MNIPITECRLCHQVFASRFGLTQHEQICFKPTSSFMRIEKLRAGLRSVAQDIIENAEDTIWARDHISMTVVEKIDILLDEDLQCKEESKQLELSDYFNTLAAEKKARTRK